MTLDYQSCGVVLVESGDLEGYERFRKMAVARFIIDSNGDADGRILKTCLLPPVHESTLVQLKPLGATVEKWTEAQPPEVMAGWSAIPIALWKHRIGDFHRAEHYCRLALNPADQTALTATLDLILAMACYRNGKADEAREHLTHGRSLVEAKFKSALDRGAGGVGLWYDWLFARVLLREAEAMIAPASK